MDLVVSSSRKVVVALFWERTLSIIVSLSDSTGLVTAGLVHSLPLLCPGRGGSVAHDTVSAPGVICAKPTDNGEA